MAELGLELLLQIAMGQNENVTFIPDYKDLYSGDLKDQFYVSRLLKDNFEKRVPDK